MPDPVELAQGQGGSQASSGASPTSAATATATTGPIASPQQAQEDSSSESDADDFDFDYYMFDEEVHLLIRHVNSFHASKEQLGAAQAHAAELEQEAHDYAQEDIQFQVPKVKKKKDAAAAAARNRAQRLNSSIANQRAVVAEMAQDIAPWRIPDGSVLGIDWRSKLQQVLDDDTTVVEERFGFAQAPPPVLGKAKGGLSSPGTELAEGMIGYANDTTAAETDMSLLKNQQFGSGGFSFAKENASRADKTAKADELRKGQEKAGVKGESADDLKARTDAATYATDTVGGLMGIFQMAKAIKDPDKAFKDRLAEGTLGGLQALESTLKIAGAATDSDATKAAGTITEGIKNALIGIKGILEGLVAAEDASAEVDEDWLQGEPNPDFSASQVLAGTMATVQVAQAGLNSAKNFTEVLKASAANSNIMGAIPGLDLALASLTIIKGIVDIRTWRGQYVKLKVRQSELARAEAVGDQPATAQDGDVDVVSAEDELRALNGLIAKSEALRKSDARRANQEAVLAETNKRLADLAGKAELPRVKRWYRTLLGRPAGVQDEKEKLLRRKAQLANAIAAQTGQKAANLGDGPGADRIQEFQLVRELMQAEVKRIKRKGVIIGAESLKVAGAIAKLTGAAAPLGLGLSAAGSGVEASLPAARAAKQAARDRAARKVAKGKQQESHGTFDMDITKSTAAKADYRKQMANKLWGMLGSLAGRDMADAAFRKDLQTVKLYVEATGVHFNSLGKETDGAEVYKKLLEGIASRE